MSNANPESLTEVFDRLIDKTDGDEVSVRDLLEAFDSRSHGPLLLVPALIAILPTGAIPGVPTTLAVVIMLLAGQMLLSRTRPWLPNKLLSLSVDRDRMVRGLKRGRRWVKPLDAITRQRLHVLTHGPMIGVVACVCIALAAFMIPLELLPFAVIAPASAIAVMAIGITARDGLIVLLGLLLTLGCAGFAVWLAI